MTHNSLRHRSSPAVLKNFRVDPLQIFKIDAYDEQFLRHRSSPAVLQIQRVNTAEFARYNLETLIVYKNLCGKSIGSSSLGRLGRPWAAVADRATSLSIPRDKAGEAAAYGKRTSAPVSADS